MPSEHTAVTMMADAVHNPAEPRHFMKLVPVPGRAAAKLPDGTTLAESENAFFAIEISRDFYPPVVYFPRPDVAVNLLKSDKVTHCPLKGDASYFSVREAGGSSKDMVWAYENPVSGAEALSDLVAFYPDRCVIQLEPA
ncbi:MAG: DUF427 domain-containing protein [Altererythrobacter sp.]|nr:DUF427 domain-containing protein [Altererythrobacter sp.]